MLKKISNDNIHCQDYDWHICRHHFSFADYHDSEKMNFGVLRALNDDIIQPSHGFEPHPHDNMEIISYCVQGELSHTDAFGNEEKLQRGDVQYLCAGSGIVHSEINRSKSKDLRFIQIWITPDRDGLKPRYRKKRFAHEPRRNMLQKVASKNGADDSIEINQNASIYVSEIEKGASIVHSLAPTRRCYLLCVEGTISINHEILHQHEAIQIANHAQVSISAVENCQLLLIEMN